MRRREQKAELIAELEECKRFETLLSDLVARFVILRPGEVDAAIEEAQRCFCEAFGLDRSTLWEPLAGDPENIVLTHLYQHKDGSPVIHPEDVPPPVESGWTIRGRENLPPVKQIRVNLFCPWVIQKLRIGETVAISSMEELPAEARRDREFFLRYGTRSTVLVPMSVEGCWLGILSFAALREERSWSEAQVRRFQLVAQVFANALTQSRLGKANEDRLRFETLLADLSSRFINLSPGEVDREIEGAQRRVGECLDLNLIGLWQWSPGSPPDLRLTHVYRSMGGPPIPEGLDSQQVFPWCLEQVLAGRTIVCPDVEKSPPEAARDLESWHNFDIKSHLTFPLAAGGGPIIGALSFNSLRERREWPDALVKRLKLVAQIFANTLDRKRTEEALRQSEERVNLAAEAAGAGLWVLDPAKGVFWVTAKAREIFGFDPAVEVTVQVFLDRVHPGDLELVQRTIREALHEKRDVGIEYRIVRGDGQVRWVASHGRPSLGPDGKVNRLMGLTIDITERKRAEAALKESEERFRLVLEANSEGVWDWKIQTGDAYFSPRYSGMLGYTPEEFATSYQSWKDLVHPDDYERVHQTHMDHFEKHKDFRVELRMRKKSGEWCWILSRGMVIERDAEGVPLRMVGTHLDITARKHTEEALARELRFHEMLSALSSRFVGLKGERLGEAIEGALDLVAESYQMDVASLCQFSGEGRQCLPGHSWNSPVGSVISALHADPEFSWVHDKVLMGEGYFFPGEHEPTPASEKARAVLKKAGIRSFAACPLSDGGEVFGVLSLVTCREDRAWDGEAEGRLRLVANILENVLARQRAEARGDQLREELGHATRVTLLGELTSTLAHEVNRPLAAILSNAQAARHWLSAGSPAPAELREVLDDIIADDKRAGHVIHRIHALLQRQHQPHEPVEVNQLVRDVAELLAGELAVADVGLRLEMAEGLPIVHGGLVEIQQVLMNLMVNAIQAMRASGASERLLTVTTQGDGRKVTVRVRDTGPGITETALEKLWDPFFTTKPGGLGMGLSISRRIVEAHGGRLAAENAPEGGAAFWFSLPIGEAS